MNESQFRTSMQTIKNYIDNNKGSGGTSGSVSWNDIANRPTSLPANGGNADTVGGYTIWFGTQAELDAITVKDANTIYLVKEG